MGNIEDTFKSLMKDANRKDLFFLVIEQVFLMTDEEVDFELEVLKRPTNHLNLGGNSVENKK